MTFQERMNSDPEQAHIDALRIFCSESEIITAFNNFLIIKDFRLYFPNKLIVFSKALTLQFLSVLKDTIKSPITLKHTVICSKLKLKLKTTKMLWRIDDLHAGCTCPLPPLSLCLHFQNKNSGLILWPTQYPDNAYSLYPYVITGFTNVSPRFFRKVENWYVFSLFFVIPSCFKKHRAA